MKLAIRSASRCSGVIQIHGAKSHFFAHNYRQIYTKCSRFSSKFSLSKNIRNIGLYGSVQIDTTGVSFEDHFEFPELKTLYISRGVYSDDSDSVAFRYFCTNAPKLKDINVSSRYVGDYDCIATSIGSLLSRPALRNLEIGLEDSDDEDQTGHESIMNLFNCPTEKPELECLKIDFNYN